jgi:hypothetical protein
MTIASDGILDLGDFTSFSLERCLKEKMDTSVLDEGGLYSPLSVSLIIPTKFGRGEGREVEREALKKILSECSGLVDAGYLDEIVVIDATRDKNGNPDFRVLQDVVKVAYDEIGLFREQVNLLAKYGSENQKGKRGLTDFFIKVVHQFDENIPKVLAKFGVFGVTGFFGIPFGKGSGLWLSIPITSGDILCFVDSDILNFRKEFVIALCHPIIYSWNLREAGIKFVKAYYKRLTKTPDLPPDEAILGGRVCRLFTIPLIQAATKSLGVYKPLNAFKYPLAGEFALSRDTFENLNIPAAYFVELYMLFQLLGIIGNASMAQVDLQIYNHIGQSLPKLGEMARQIGSGILERMIEKRNKPLTGKEKKQILQEYQRRLKHMMKESKKLITNLEKVANVEIPRKLVHFEDEKECFGVFLEAVEDILGGNVSGKRNVLPSWNQIKGKTGEYFTLREILRRRSNQSTYSRLIECNLVIQLPK